MQLIPRKLLRCRPVRDSGHVAAAWVCVCWDVIPHHTIHTCVHEQVCVLRQLSVHGVLWRQGAERHVSCDLDDR